MNALSITLFLYYFADGKEFDELRTLVVNKACERIANVPSELLKKTTEMVILLLEPHGLPLFVGRKQDQGRRRIWFDEERD